MSEAKLPLLLDADGQPRDRIVGFETEYGLQCEGIIEGRKLKKIDNDDISEEIASMHYRTDHCQYQNDGDRQYVDVGNHPELSTAEETSYLQAAYRLLRGHVKIKQDYARRTNTFLDEMYAEFGVPFNVATNIFANTTDLENNSWGSHANILAPSNLPFDDYMTALMVHNVSRIVWAGAGHVVPHADLKGYDYHLSEKAQYIFTLYSSDTVKNRPIVNTRNVPYAAATRYRRIHDATGESIFNPHGNALRLGSTSVILRACELGVDFSDLEPDEPLRAIRNISEDPSLRQLIRLKDGRYYRGTDLQLELAERAFAAAERANYLTEQDKRWGNNWITLVDDLRSDPQKAARRTDWVVKRNLVERQVEAKQGETDESPGLVAWHRDAEYHRIGPDEGTGMQLVRHGFYTDAPSEELIDNEMPLPETRAKVRAFALRRLRLASLAYWGGTWEYVAAGEEHYHRYALPEPYDTDPTQIETWLEQQAA
ncbi:MAG TPA: proteasome accessory factor PafA2 family protein [Patescibacteria group bacterium]|nr:proteasome accessory factor PafA2 family protein [Patescibacteria group bacterium]